MSTAEDLTAEDDGWLRIRRWRGVIVVSASGNLDAHNAPQLFGLLSRFATLRNGVVVDLTALDYCGVAGLRMLLTLGASYHRTDTPWALVPGPIPVCLLVLTHHRAAVPLADTVDAAIRLLADLPRPPRLRLVR